MTTMWTTVLFDLDHTLFDSDASMRAAYEASVAAAGIDDPAAVYDTFNRINSALWRRVEAHEISPNEVRVLRFEQLLDELGVEGDAHRMADVFVETLVAAGDLYDGARELLDRLAGPVRLGLVTNGIGQVQRGRLARLQLADVFETVVISGEVGVAKPAPAIFDLALDAMAVADRSEVVMVGDSLSSDIAGGEAAGLATIWYEPSGAAARSAGDPAPTHRVGALGEIADLVL